MIHFRMDKNHIAQYTRHAAYGLMIEDGMITLVKTPRGVFLPGGGFEEGESPQDCIGREFIEELGMAVELGEFYLRTKLTDVTPSRDYPIDMVAHCYYVTDKGDRFEPVEKDHEAIRVSLQEAAPMLKLVHQAWVIESLLKVEPQPTLVTYNPHWPVWFRQIAYVMDEVLGDRLSAIEHVGSTAVPGMTAKPRIDMDLVMKDEGDFDDICRCLEGIGYSHIGDYGIAEREVFKRSETFRDDLLDSLPHNLYVCPSTSRELKRHLHFRDRLLADETLRDAYIALKEEIISKVGLYDRAGYVDMKARDYDCFFEEILKGAQ